MDSTGSLAMWTPSWISLLRKWNINILIIIVFKLVKGKDKCESGLLIPGSYPFRTIPFSIPHWNWSIKLQVFLEIERNLDVCSFVCLRVFGGNSIASLDCYWYNCSKHKWKHHVWFLTTEEMEAHLYSPSSDFSNECCSFWFTVHSTLDLCFGNKYYLQWQGHFYFFWLPCLILHFRKC